MPVSMTIIISVVSRIWITLGEILFLVIAIIWIKVRGPGHVTSSSDPRALETRRINGQEENGSGA
jgi:hypothetical protein